MLSLFRSVGDRLRALFATDVALDFESMFVRRQADRKAEILRHAAELERQGMKSVAAELREQANTISIGRPLATILPATAELCGDERSDIAQLTTADETASVSVAVVPAPTPKKKAR